jgi:hypothetical protein
VLGLEAREAGATVTSFDDLAPQALMAGPRIAGFHDEACDLLGVR